jgi:hypothetical protein
MLALQGEIAHEVQKTRSSGTFQQGGTSHVGRIYLELRDAQTRHVRTTVSIILQLHYRVDGRVVLAYDVLVQILALSEATATNNSSPAWEGYAANQQLSSPSNELRDLHATPACAGCFWGVPVHCSLVLFPRCEVCSSCCIAVAFPVGSGSRRAPVGLRAEGRAVICRR